MSLVWPDTDAAGGGREIVRNPASLVSPAASEVGGGVGYLLKFSGLGLACCNKTLDLVIMSFINKFLSLVLYMSCCQ